MKINRHKIALFIAFAGVLTVSSCFTVNYNFKGGKIPPDVKTASIQYFKNRATRVNPSLSQNFTNALRDYIENNTKLRIVNSIGDVNFEGEITDYRISPQAISKGDLAAQTRFTITIRVKFTNSKYPDDSFDTSFSRYRDFESNQDFNSVEAELSEQIIEEILDLIYNKAFVNW